MLVKGSPLHHANGMRDALALVTEPAGAEPEPPPELRPLTTEAILACLPAAPDELRDVLTTAGYDTDHLPLMLHNLRAECSTTG